MKRKRWRKNTIYFLSFLLVVDIIIVILIYGQKHPTAVLQSPSSANALPILTMICCKGRIGNQMFTYATLFGVARFNRRRPRDPLCNARYILPYFHLSMGVGDEVWLYGKDIPMLHFSNMSVRTDQDIFGVAGYYPTSFVFFDHARDDIRREFRFRSYLLEYADIILNTVRQNSAGATFVAVHVRRRWYHTHLCQYKAKSEANTEFYEKAMKLFRNRYSNVLFVVTSDDPIWAKANVRGVDVHYVGNLDRHAVYDLVVLSRCNHTIFAYGTFGFWAAYLAGGEAVYLRDYLMPNSSLLLHASFKERYLPEWVGITVDKPIHCDKTKTSIKKTAKSTVKKRSRSKPQTYQSESYDNYGLK